MNNFSQDCITYTPEGRILQIQYANKSVENAYYRTIVGVKCKDGVVLGAQKLVFSRLLVPGTNSRIYNIDRHVGMALAGKIPDGRHIMSYARTESAKFKEHYDIPVTGRVLADRLGLYLNAHTMYNSVRPFGSAEIFASWTPEDGYGLFMLEPSGLYYGYKCCTAGKGRQIAKAQFEKTDFSKITCEQALFYVCKMLNLTHEESRDKPYEIEMSWIHDKNGHVHQAVPKTLIEEAQRKALAAIDDDGNGPAA